MTLVIMVADGAENWAPSRWAARFSQRLPGRDIVIWPNNTVDPAAIQYAAVWRPPQGVLSSFPNLKVIFNLGAGVDAALADKTLPAVPLVRVATSDLTNRMSEYVLLHVLMAHRRQRYLDQCQEERYWSAKEQWAAKDLRVGVMGLGVIGIDAAIKLKMVGFDVAGWSRTPKDVPGIKCFAGDDQLPAFLARTDILVVLLPLTAGTRGILNAKTFKGLARNGRLGGPVLINAGRGGLQVEDDILAALDDNTLLSATLDVFATEPLPPEHPLWTHRKVTITPHNAADSDPEAISAYVADQIAAFEVGKPLGNVVDRVIGY